MPKEPAWLLQVPSIKNGDAVTETMEPKTGQRWKDLDSRCGKPGGMPERFVIIERVDSGFVYYHTDGRAVFPLTLRSRLGRFVKAFRPAKATER